MRCLYTEGCGGQAPMVFYGAGVGVYCLCLKRVPPGYPTQPYLYPAPDLDCLMTVYNKDRNTTLFDSVEALLDWLTCLEGNEHMISLIIQWLV